MTWNKKIGKRLLSTHSQNLNDHFAFNIEGPKVLHGRAWADLYEDENCRKSLIKASFEWSLLGHGYSRTHFGINVMGEDHDVKIDFGISGLFSFYIGLRVLSMCFIKKMADRWPLISDATFGCTGFDVFKFSVDGETLHINLMSINYMDSSKDKRQWFWSWRDRLLKSNGFKHEHIKTVSTGIPLSEGVYNATLKFTKLTKQYERFPWWPVQPSISCRIDFDDPRGIPCPRGLYGLSGSYASVHDAVAGVVSEVIKSRGSTNPHYHSGPVGMNAMNEAVNGS